MSAMAAKDNETRDPERRTDFADLIRDRRAELKDSLDTFAENAVDPVTGQRFKRGTIYRLETGAPVTPPEFWELRALAAACRSWISSRPISANGCCGSSTRWFPPRRVKPSRSFIPHDVTVGDIRERGVAIRGARCDHSWTL
jgi:hypothetical protein